MNEFLTQNPINVAWAQNGTVYTGTYSIENVIYQVRITNDVVPCTLTTGVSSSIKVAKLEYVKANLIDNPSMEVEQPGTAMFFVKAVVPKLIELDPDVVVMSVVISGDNYFKEFMYNRTIRIISARELAPFAQQITMQSEAANQFFILSTNILDQQQITAVMNFSTSV